MDSEGIIKERDKITAQIKKYVPLMRPFFDLDSTIREYSANLYKFPVNEVHKQRQVVLKLKIISKFKKLFNNFHEFNFAFDEPLALSVVDHQMVMSHPFLASGNVVSSVNKFLQDKKPSPIIVIASGDVPPNNYFSKNGFIFHDKRVPLFSVSEREYTSYYIPKREFDFVRRLKLINRWAEFDAQEQAFLIEHESFMASLDYSRAENYIDQVSIAVQKVWPMLFEPKISTTLPELLYITQEELVTDCLIEVLKEDNMLSRCLFDPQFRSAVLDNFSGIVTTWREAEQKGTHFFWRKYPSQPRSIRMYVEGSALVPQDERFKNYAVPLDRDSIIDHLRRKEIYPSLFMIFGLLDFYCGMKPLTGFGSVVYLNFFKESWLKTLEQFGMTDEKERVSMVDTSGLVVGPVVLFKRIAGEVKAPYAHDLMFQGNVIDADYLRQVFDMKFKDVLSVGVGDMYEYFCNKYIPPKEKIKKTITFDDLAEVTFGWVK